ncbi:MAG: DUF1638 domain-containing protein [Anaerolineae bacterium]
MWLRCIACEVLARPVYLCAAYSPHIVDVQLVQRGLHNRPAHLRTELQVMVDATDPMKYDAIVLGYGLCGQATDGLVAREIPLVIPRAHDCITLFLGSRERYQEQFGRYPGTFWYAQDYIERDDGSGAALAMGSGTADDLEAVYDDYVKKYGKDNADYLMEVMGAWQSHYQRAAYLDMQIGEARAVEAKAEHAAARRGWLYERVAGDMVLIRRLLAGEWDGEDNGDFLVVPPGHTVEIAYDERVIQCVVP